MDSKRRTRCPRHKDAPFGILTQVFPTGERLPTLIDHRTGLPPLLPLRFALKRRFAWGSPNTPAVYLRRIGDLYGWYSLYGFDLDSLIVSGEPVDLRDISRALVELDAGWIVLRERGAQRLIAGHISWDADDFAPAPIANVRAHNLRLLVWVMFLRWVLRPANWRGGRNLHASEASRQCWNDTIDNLDSFLSDELRRGGTSQRRSGFTAKELEVLEAVLAPDSLGRFSTGFFAPAVQYRNYVIYLMARWGGLRIGEILNTHVEDIPAGSLGLTHLWVKRRHDDAEEPRLIAPSVKRGGRKVPMPDDSLDAVRTFIRRHRRSTKWPDLLLADTHDMPLSYARAGDIAKQVRRYASREFERRHPGEAHTLDKFSWHRLRHTRARELLPLYVQLDKPYRESHGMRQFLEVFGWAAESSAEPYIWELQQEHAVALAHRIIEDDIARLWDDDTLPS